jgi:hypothetical protein
MARRDGGGSLVACLDTWSTTATSRTSAASRSPRLRGTGARFGTGRRSPSCNWGGHAIWWAVDAATEAEALELLPFFVAERSTATRVDEVEIP